MNAKIEALKIRQAAELVKMEQQVKITEALPVAPNFVHVRSLYQSVGSVAYEAKTPVEALSIFEQFAVSPSYITRMGGTVSVCSYADEKAESTQEVHATINCDQYGAKLEFYTMLENIGMVEINVKIPLHFFGRYAKDLPRAVKNFKMVWTPCNKTKEMTAAVRYAPAYHNGPQSGSTIVYVMYDREEVTNQLADRN